MNIFHKIVNKYKESQKKSLNKIEFRDELLRAVSDGVLTPEEINDLTKRKKEFDLSEDDIKRFRVETFKTAFASVKSDEKITKEEEQELSNIQNYLGLSDVEIEKDKKDLAKLRLLYEIQQGNLPNIQLTNIVMFKDERAYWSEPAILIEEKVVSRRYEGGSQGVSFRITKGISYRVGGYKGHLISETGIVPISVGDLIITNSRLIFRGDRKSFTTDLNKILDVQLFTNGIFLSINNRTKQIMIKFVQEEKHDVLGAIMTHAINHYGDTNDKKRIRF